MKFNPKLTKQEKRIIKKAAKYQMNSLTRILNRKSEDNIDLYCALRKLSAEVFDDLLRKDIQVFQELYDNPRSFLNLDEMNISLIKHIMENFINQKSLQDYKPNIWRKFNTKDNFIYQLEN